MPNRTRGFTLIELLVVISIIALLVAMLLPALAQSRKTAQAVLCQSQIKQLGYSYEYYANEFDDYIPGSRYPHDGWQDALGSIGSLGTKAREKVIHWDFTSIWNRDVYPILKCPSDSDVYFGTGGAAQGSTFPRWASSYTLSSYDQNWSISRYAYGKPRKGWTLGYENKNLSPYEAALQMDSTAQTSQSWFLAPENATGTAGQTGGQTRKQIGYRHVGEAANVLYWDLHVKPNHYYKDGDRVWEGFLYPSNPT